MKGWTLVYSDNYAPRIALIKQLLEASEIPVIVINKQDSSYLFGLQEVHVPVDFAVQAIHRIKTSSE